jgi:hypothetical protein
MFGSPTYAYLGGDVSKIQDYKKVLYDVAYKIPEGFLVHSRSLYSFTHSFIHSFIHS